jgi:hypothetical protein
MEHPCSQKQGKELTDRKGAIDLLQQSLLLDFKIKVNGTKNFATPINYNFIKGIWELQGGTPFVNVMINNLNEDYGVTVLTETREGIDRSERS